MSASVTVSGIDSCLRLFTDIIDNLESRNKTFLERLSKIGVNTASIHFSHAAYDGDNDVTVKAEWQSDNTIVIRASGTTVLFIEFGTGTIYPDYRRDYPATIGGRFQRGEYGKGLGANPPWHYRGNPGTNGVLGKNGSVTTYGNPAAMAMYYAWKDMRQQILEIAREVYVD